MEAEHSKDEEEVGWERWWGAFAAQGAALLGRSGPRAGGN